MKLYQIIKAYFNHLQFIKKWTLDGARKKYK